MDENNKLTLIRTKQGQSQQYEPSSPSIAEWIAGELGYLAVLWDRPLTPQRLDAYVQELMIYPSQKLAIAFQRLRTEWRSDNFGFPLLADFIECMKPQLLEGPPTPGEWKAPQLPAHEDIGTSEEIKDWWRDLKQQIARIGLKKRDEKPIKPLTEPMREMTELEYAERIALLKRQAEEAKRKYGA